MDGFAFKGIEVLVDGGYSRQYESLVQDRYCKRGFGCC